MILFGYRKNLNVGTIFLTRVAWTLKHSGLKNIAIIDGGHNKWIKENKAISADMVKPASGNFTPKWNKYILATKDYVMKHLGKSTLVDDRAPDEFFGITKLDFVEKFGHIKGAVSLPTSWIFKDGLYRSKEELQAIAEGVLGKDKKKEIITYCDSGRLGTSWFVLTEILGYEKVTMYDGSMQEFAKDPNAPIVRYSWK